MVFGNKSVTKTGQIWEILYQKQGFIEALIDVNVNGIEFFSHSHRNQLLMSEPYGEIAEKKGYHGVPKLKLDYS